MQQRKCSVWTIFQTEENIVENPAWADDLSSLGEARALG